MNTNPVRTKVDHSFIARVKKLPAYLKDGGVPLWKKLALVAVLVYTVSPVDAIPDVIPIIGWLDDIGVLGITIAWLLRDLDTYVPPSDVTEGRTPVESRRVEPGEVESGEK